MLWWRTDSMPYDAGSRKDVRVMEKQAKLEEQQRREVVSGIMSVAPGRKWMCELLEHCHIFSTSFSDAAIRMAFMEGQREVGLLLLTDIMAACPNEYITMMGERNARQSAIDARLSRRRPNADGSDSGSEADDGSSGDDSANFDDAGADNYAGSETRG
jgi:hypothetical protein